MPPNRPREVARRQLAMPQCLQPNLQLLHPFLRKHPFLRQHPLLLRQHPLLLRPRRNPLLRP
jgi:hypothetical protein